MKLPVSTKLLRPFAACACALAVVGCVTPRAEVTRLSPARLEPVATPEIRSDATTSALSGAGGEWLDFLAEITGDATAVRVSPLRGEDGTTHALETQIYALRDVPLAPPTPSLRRWLGDEVTTDSLPRALVPLQHSGSRYSLPGRPAELWVDVRLPHGLPAGEFQFALEALADDGTVLDRLPVSVRSHGFDLPMALPLAAAAPLEWDELTAIWPEAFANVSARTLARGLDDSAEAVAVLDELSELAKANHLEVHFPDIAPIVVWPSGERPRVDWADYDALAEPWLSSPNRPRVWPLPRARGLAEYPPNSREDYWREAATHFRERGWLNAAVAWLGVTDLGPAQLNIWRPEGLTLAERARLSVEAGRVARATFDARIALPLEADQVRFSGPGYEGLFPPSRSSELILLGDPLVTEEPDRPWPAGLDRPSGFWLDASEVTIATPGDARLWGWAAFLREASVLVFDQPVVDPTKTVEAGRPVWFYPGRAFDAEQPVIPTVQAKWIRRALQDHAYLRLAANRGGSEVLDALVQNVVSPVRVRAAQPLESMADLLLGLTHSAAWDEAIGHVAGLIADREGQLHARQTWLARLETPKPFATRVQWDLAEVNDTQPSDEAARQFAGFSREAPPELRLYQRVEVAFRNNAPPRPEGFELAWTQMPDSDLAGESPWQTLAPSRDVSAPPTGELAVEAVSVWAPVNALPRYAAGSQPGRLRVTNWFSGASGATNVAAPAFAVDERRAVPVLDGRLGEWSSTEAIQDGPLVRYHNRQTIRTSELERMETETELFAGWTRAGLHFAFKVDADAAQTADGDDQVARTFVERDAGRIVGEEACEVLLQPVFAEAGGEAMAGPLLHLVFKPNGTLLAQRRADSAALVTWQPVAADLRYAARLTDDGAWRGEVTIPWSALNLIQFGGRPPSTDLLARVPNLLRFNFSQHRPTAASASWAGPIDDGRDESVTGALVIRRGEEAR